MILVVSVTVLIIAYQLLLGALGFLWVVVACRYGLGSWASRLLFALGAAAVGVPLGWWAWIGTVGSGVHSPALGLGFAGASGAVASAIALFVLHLWIRGGARAAPFGIQREGTAARRP